MVERSTVAQVAQIGVEATPGTAVPATRRLGSLSLSPSITNEADMFRPEGLKFATVQVQNREWADVSGTGKPTYEEVIIPLSGAMDAATVSEVLDGATPTGAYEWLFSPDPAQADAPKTFTLEKGQEGVQAERFAHLLFNSFGLTVSRTAADLTTSGFAKRAETGHDMTDGLAVPADLTPIAPGHFSVYMADTHAGLEVGGASDPAKRMGRVISANPSIEGRYTAAWFVNQAEGSFTTWVEAAEGAGGSFALNLEANTEGIALVDNLRAGDTLFVRLEALGPVIYDAGVQPDLRHMFRWDMAVKVQNAEPWADADGIYGLPFTLSPVYDGTWGKAHEVTVRNTVASL